MRKPTGKVAAVLLAALGTAVLASGLLILGLRVTHYWHNSTTHQLPEIRLLPQGSSAADQSFGQVQVRAGQRLALRVCLEPASAAAQARLQAMSLTLRDNRDLELVELTLWYRQVRPKAKHQLCYRSQSELFSEGHEGRLHIEGLNRPRSLKQNPTGSVKIAVHVLKGLEILDFATLSIIALGVILLLSGWRGRPQSDVIQPPFRPFDAALGLLLVLAVMVLGSLLFGSSDPGIVAATTALMLSLLAAPLLLAVFGSELRDAVQQLLLARRTQPGYQGVVSGLLLALLALAAQIALATDASSPMEQLVSRPSGLMLVCGLGLVAPICEEVFYRGFLFGAVEAQFGGRVALAATAIVFSLAHYPQLSGDTLAWSIVSIVGLFLSFVRWRTQSVLFCSIVHFSYNFTLIVPTLVAGA